MNLLQWSMHRWPGRVWWQGGDRERQRETETERDRERETESEWTSDLFWKKNGQDILMDQCEQEREKPKGES